MKKLAIIACLLLVAGFVFGQNLSGRATYGEYSLNAGFSPDPTTYNVSAGGPNRVTVDGVSGYILASGPDVRVNYRAGSFPLYIWVRNCSVDAVLFVNDGEGTWWSDDDSGPDSLMPGIGIDNPASGTYDIWIGTYSAQNPYPRAVLCISELGW